MIMLTVVAISIMGAAISVFFTRPTFWTLDVIATSILVVVIAIISHDLWTAITCFGMLAGLAAVVVGKVRTDHFKVTAK